MSDSAQLNLPAVSMELRSKEELVSSASIETHYDMGDSERKRPTREELAIAGHLWAKANGQSLDRGELDLALAASDPDSSEVTLSGTALPPFAEIVDAGSGTGTLQLRPAIADSGLYRMVVVAADSGSPPLATSDAVTVQVMSCHALTLSHSGAGSDPVTSLPGSPVCQAGEYYPDISLELVASPADGWTVKGWSGTSDDQSSAAVNSLIMPASNHAAAVIYVEQLIFADGFESGDLLAWTRSVNSVP
jgi:hypothetical protein